MRDRELQRDEHGGAERRHLHRRLRLAARTRRATASATASTFTAVQTSASDPYWPQIENGEARPAW